MRKLILLFIMFVFSLMPAFAEKCEKFLPSATGVVREIASQTVEENGVEAIKQVVELEILTGQFKGEKRIVENVISGNPYYDINLKKGAKVVVHVEPQDEFVVSAEDVDFFITDIRREGALWLLVGIFSAFIIVIGRKKGALALVSIVATVGLIFSLMMPLVLHGVCPIFAALLVGVLSTIVTIYLVAGVNYKSTSAILGTVLSLLIAGILAIITIKMAHLTGFVSEDNMFLHSVRPDLNMQGILAAAIILSALGALMDVGVSIASTINEVYMTDPTLSVRQLFNSGMNVGRDVIGTMSNTLILVYLGASLPLVLLSSSIDIQKFFNLNQVATEISSALIGSIAILACVPVTALICANLIVKKSKIYKS